MTKSGYYEEIKSEGNSNGWRIKEQKTDDNFQNDGKFMRKAHEEAEKSKLNDKVGVCIVNVDGDVIGVGHNKVCPGIESPETYVKTLINDINETNKGSESAEVCHAVMNAVVNCYTKNIVNLRECVLYVTRFPCNKCSKIIIQSGIRCVVFEKERNRTLLNTITSEILLGKAGVEIFQWVDAKFLRFELKTELEKLDSGTFARKSYTSWDEYFMLIALHISQKGKHPEKQVGVCLVNDENIIMAFGYHSENDSKAVARAVKDAEPNALQECTLYMTIYPSDECIQLIKDKNIKHIVYNKERANSPSMDSIKKVTIKKVVPTEKAYNTETDDGFFMAVALIAQGRSKDPDKQVGACIVNQEKEIIGVGYNGMPNVPEAFDDNQMPWCRPSSPAKSNKHHYVCHAEMNALTHKIKKTVLDSQKCVLYTTVHPCYECAKMIIQLGIKRVVYLKKSRRHLSKSVYLLAELLLHKAGIRVESSIETLEATEA